MLQLLKCPGYTIVVTFYKVINGEVVVTTDDLGLEVADVRTRAAHCHKFKEKRARTNLLKYVLYGSSDNSSLEQSPRHCGGGRLT